MEPAAPERAARLRFIVPVSAQNIAAADQDFPGNADRDLPATVIGDFHLAMEPAFPGRARLAQPVARLLVDRDRCGLRQPVGLAHRDAARLYRVDQVEGHNGGAGGEQPQAGKVRFGPARKVDHRLDGCRDQDELRRAVLDDRAQRRAGVETAVQDHRPADIEGGRGEDVEAAHMEHRQHRQHPVGAGQPGIVDAVEGVDLDRPLVEHRALGAARGAGSVNQQAGGFRPGLRVAVFAGRRLRAAGDLVRGDDGGVRATRRRRRARQVRAAGVRNQQPGRRVAKDIGELRRCEPPVERREQCADPRAGEKQRQHRGAVEAEECDPVAALDAVDGLQRPRMAANHRRQARIADVLALEADCGFRRGEGGVLLDPERQVVHSSASPRS